MNITLTQPAPDAARLARVAGQRAKTLDEVAGYPKDLIVAAMREWLDVFHGADTPARAWMLSVEPRLLPDAKRNAYFGALAEYMAGWAGLPVPAWCYAESRFLHRPWFPLGLESLKAYCLVHSPAAFRQRMIFIDGPPIHQRARYGAPDLLPGQTLSWKEFQEQNDKETVQS